MENDELLQDFVVESMEHLSDIEAEFLEIESAKDDLDLELINKVFRALHSIKGASGFLGLERINELSHSMENVLNSIRQEELDVTSEIVDTLLRSSDLLKVMFEDVTESNETDVAPFVTELEAIIIARLSEEPVDVNAADATETAAEPVTPEAAEPQPEPVAADAKPSPKPKPKAVTATGAPSKSASPSVRVPVSVLDHLMNLAGELVLGRNQLLQELSGGTREEKTGLDLVGSRIDQITSELQEAVMQTRMQPVGSVFSKFPRIVRDLSGQLEKQCTLVAFGEDVELDKTIIEAISDPLTHLIRNAVDHGVELPSVRAAAGKPECGSIELRAFHDGGTVNITISDDGAGIDASRLREKAVEKGILTREQASEMHDREAVRLIFHPGFSMAEKVTDISGRGVGMDVVKTNLEQIGGMIDIDTRLGVGTTIAIKLPLTLAIIPALILSDGSHRFALPQLNIVELVRVMAGDKGHRIERIKDAEVLRLRDDLLPLVRLGAALETETPQEAGATEPAVQHVIVVEAGNIRFGLVVSELHDSEEIVVKPLGRHTKDSPCLSGATILGDGRVALILDVSGIAKQAELSARDNADESTRATSDDAKAMLEQQSVVLFTNHPDEQFAFPTSLILRIDRVRSEQITVLGGVSVIQSAEGALPVLRLHELANVRAAPELEYLYVIVVQLADRELGLVVPSLKDIEDISSEIDNVVLREPGIAGSLSIDGCETRLIDIFELAEKAHPAWFEERQHEIARRKAESEVAGTVLLAEDSGFFRKKVKNYITGLGFKVADYEDGLAAWNALDSGEVEVSLIVTDIEMPNMNGLEFTERVKNDERFKHLKVIALTSLASEEDIRRGKAIGVDDYQIKMDREQLLSAIEKYIKGGVPVAHQLG